MSAATHRIGLVGAGRMGCAIGARLRDLGRDLLVWNRTPAHAQPLVDAGASLAETCAEVAEKCGTVLVIVRDADAIGQVYDGADGLLAADLSGRTIVEMTTADIGTIKAAMTAVTRRGGAAVDAPISGTIRPARHGELVVMAGGTPTDFDAAKPVLDLLARKVIHAGPLGAGIAMKLALNLPLATYWQTLGEGLALGRAYGLRVEDMLATIVDSKAAIGALPSKLTRILGTEAQVEFDLAGMCKDLACMQRSAEAAGLRLPASGAAAASAEAAVRHGWGDEDLSRLVRFVADSDSHL